MNRIGLLFSLLLILLLTAKTNAQTLICNDQIDVSLDANCSFTMLPEHVLEGIILNDCIVEIDKTAPFGNGPWVPAVFGPADVGNTYQVRVKHVPSGNICWGNVHITDKLPPKMQCSGISTITLDATGAVTVGIGDLAVTIADNCGTSTATFANSQSTVSFDCSNVGVNTVTLEATDQLGNSATCVHTVIVANSDVCLSDCISECPPSVVTTFDEAYNNLLPAYALGDWTELDAYGDVVYNHQTCTLLDSVYSVDHQTGAGGYDWFVRQWILIDGVSGFAVCEQHVLYPTTKTVSVQGKVFLDNTPNCTFDTGEPVTSIFPLMVTLYPSGTIQSFAAPIGGNYDLPIVFTPADTAAVLHLVLPTGVSSVCPSALSIPANTTTSLFTFDIGLQTDGDCPLMQADLGSFTSRRCQANTFTLQYCNVGLDTAYDAYVTVQFDSLMTLQSAGLPYTGAADSFYTFQVGDVPPFTCASFNMSVFISCDAEIEQTLCVEATAYPNTFCDGAWAGPEMAATAHCDGDTVNLALWNVGQEDMTVPLEFIVIEDFIMYKEQPFLLAAGDSMTVKVPANGSTWRIETVQPDAFPVQGLVAAAIEGCGGLNTPGLINAFAQSDYGPSNDIECVEVSGSFDPNDKRAVPRGYGADHIIRANEELEYTIRFQNTGNDTAFQVVLVDTLSPLLNALTLQTGVSSHPYKVEIYPGGIVHFVFKPIALVDSTTNEAASHGFVQFRIAQQPDLPGGTVIENTAAIYFDQNDPVITNTARHTIGYPFLVLESETPHAPGVRVSLTPNPFREQAILAVEGKPLQQGRLLLYDAQGRLLRSQEMTDNRAILQRGNLPEGMYFFQITDHGVSVAGGKMQAY